MSTHEITLIHADKHLYQSRLIFLVNGFMLTFDCVSPAYNDYSEFRIGGMRLASGKYDASGNTAELNPIEGWEVITITDEEFTFLQNNFGYDNMNLDGLVAFDEPLLYSSYRRDILEHFLVEEVETDNEYPLFKESVVVTAKHYKALDNICSQQGLYSLLIKVLELFAPHWMKIYTK